jgi:flagellar hook assembly protein FlgD
MEIPVHFTVVLNSGIAGYEKTNVLVSNYPNPFTSQTTFEVSIPQQSGVLLEVYDFTGKRVAVIVNKQLSKGTYKFTWQPETEAGVYFYILKTDYKELSGKMILMK